VKCHGASEASGFQQGSPEQELLLGGAMMNARTILILFALLFFVSATVTTSHATTTFGGSRIVAIDEGQKTITFRTKEGQTWTLPVADSKLLDQKVAKGDQVTIEIDLNDRIIDVVKLSDVPTPPRDAGGQTEDR
jgi:hypothetical protein